MEKRPLHPGLPQETLANFANSTKRTRQEADNDDTIAIEEPLAKKAKIDTCDAKFEKHAEIAVTQQMEDIFHTICENNIQMALELVASNMQLLHARNNNAKYAAFYGLTVLMALIKCTENNKENEDMVREWVLVMICEYEFSGSNDKENNTILHYLSKYPGFVKLLQKFQHCTSMRTACNNQGMMPLHVAIVERNWPVVELLIQAATFYELNTVHQLVDKAHLPFCGTLVHFLIYHAKCLPEQGLPYLKLAINRADLTIVTEQAENQSCKFVGMNSLMLAILCSTEQVALVVFDECKRKLDSDTLQLVLQTEAFGEMNARQLCEHVGNMGNVAQAIDTV